MTVSQSDSLILNSRLSRSTPALLTRIVGAPSSAATARRRPRPGRSSETSQPTASALPPAAVIFSTVSLQAASSRSSTATARPSAASRTAVAAPMPRAAPVTTATRCSVVDMLVLLALGCGSHGAPRCGERPLSTFSRRDARSPGTRCQRPPGAIPYVAPHQRAATRRPVSAPAGRAAARPPPPDRRSARCARAPAGRPWSAARSASGTAVRRRRGRPARPPLRRAHTPSTARSAARTPATSAAGVQRQQLGLVEMRTGRHEGPGAAVHEHARVEALAALDPGHDPQQRVLEDVRCPLQPPVPPPEPAGARGCT